MEAETKGGARIRRVAEVPRRLGTGSSTGPDAGFPPVAWVHPDWEIRFPWLAQGTTGRTPEDGSGDFALFRDGGAPVSEVVWEALVRGVGFKGVFHSRQPHGVRVDFHESPAERLTLTDPADGHLTLVPDTLLAITVADCVPVFLLDPTRRGVGLLHSGWRGTVGGILEAGVRGLVEQVGSEVQDLHLHLGPAICGRCYEVGPEVHEALGLPLPPEARPVDLRGLLAERALGLGLESTKITVSSLCTLCQDSPFFSHRAGDPERQLGFLGIRGDPGP